jgi:hypothetical protein
MILDMDRVFIPGTVSELADLFIAMAMNAPEYRNPHLINMTPEGEFARTRIAIARVKGLNQTIRDYLLARTDENWERLQAGERGQLSLSFQELSHFLRSRRYRQPRDLIIDRSNATPLDL